MTFQVKVQVDEPAPRRRFPVRKQKRRIMRKGDPSFFYPSFLVLSLLVLASSLKNLRR